MTSELFKALLIDADPDDVRVVREMLAEDGFARFDVEIAPRLAEGMRRLSQGDVDVVLLDLSLPDSQGVNTISLLRAHASDVPIVVLTGTSDENAGVQALHAGAQEYLLKEHATGAVLIRALRYAIERKRLELTLHHMTIIDDLTGLHNRRGFLQRAPLHLRLARRNQKRALLALIDMDGLKYINDTYGHPEGDKAIVTVASVLKRTFRDDDIIARIGGDEFAALAIVGGHTAERVIVERLEKNLKTFGTTPSGHALTISLGLSAMEASDLADLNEILKRADESLYEHKRGKGRSAEVTPQQTLQNNPAR